MDIAVSKSYFDISQIATMDLRALLSLMKTSPRRSSTEFRRYIDALISEERYNDAITFIVQSLSPQNALDWAIHCLRIVDPMIEIHPAWRGIDQWLSSGNYQAVSIEEPIQGDHPACWLHAALFWLNQDQTPSRLIAEAISAAIMLQIRMTSIELRSRRYRFFAEQAARYIG